MKQTRIRRAVIPPRPGVSQDSPARGEGRLCLYRRHTLSEGVVLKQSSRRFAARRRGLLSVGFSSPCSYGLAGMSIACGRIGPPLERAARTRLSESVEKSSRSMRTAGLLLKLKSAGESGYRRVLSECRPMSGLDSDRKGPTNG